jgi:thioredoxin 1
MLKEFTDANFELEVLKAQEPVLVDFWAPWCGPCKMVGPVVEALAGEMAGKVTVGKVNVDDHQLYAQKYGVMSIPTLILFKDGEEVSRTVGFSPKEELVKFVGKAL